MNPHPDTPYSSSLIEDIVAGRFTDPNSGQRLSVPYKSIVMARGLKGRELELGRRLAVVSDPTTHAAMGERVEQALTGGFEIKSIVLEHPHADEGGVATLLERTRDADALIAVGSGTLNDLCKYVTFLTDKPYAVFGTAASMNGYTSTTSSITLHSGLKTSLPAHAPQGVFLDLEVSAAAPGRLAASGFGDCLCRSTAQVDGWLAHRLLGAPYTPVPFAIQEADEAEMFARATQLPLGNLEALAALHRVLTLCGLGVSLTGTSHHGSMGEHQISHYIDCFAGERHPGTLHGQQVGVASITMARLQARFLALEEPPILRPTRMDYPDMLRRYGPQMAPLCLEQWQPKALDEAGTARLNARLRELWPELVRECAAFALSPEFMRDKLEAAGGATSAQRLGLDAGFYRQAVLHAREMRNRFSVLDLLGDAGTLEGWVDEALKEDP